MRVAMVDWANASPFAGGRSLQVYDLAEALSKLHFDVTVLNARRLDRVSLAKIRLADLIHVHGGVTPALIAPLRLFPNRGRGITPMVCTLHGWHYRNHKDRLERVIECCGLYACTRITVLNHTMRDALPTILRNRAVVIPNGVLSRNMHRSISFNTIDVLWLGRICKEKGLFEALTAFQLALTKVPTLRLHIVGPVEESELLPLLEKAVNEPSRRVSHIPFLDDPWNTLRADILLHTPHYDAFPRSVLEAMSVGTAVVATAVGGIPEMIEHETTGLLAAANDVCAIADQLVRLATDIGLRQAVVRQARENFERCFTIDLMAARFAALYEQVASG